MANAKIQANLAGAMGGRLKGGPCGFCGSTLKYRGHGPNSLSGCFRHLLTRSEYSHSRARSRRPLRGPQPEQVGD